MNEHFVFLGLFGLMNAACLCNAMEQSKIPNFQKLADETFNAVNEMFAACHDSSSENNQTSSTSNVISPEQTLPASSAISVPATAPVASTSESLMSPQPRRHVWYRMKFPDGRDSMKHVKDK